MKTFWFIYLFYQSLARVPIGIIRIILMLVDVLFRWKDKKIMYNNLKSFIGLASLYFFIVYCMPHCGVLTMWALLCSFIYVCVCARAFYASLWSVDFVLLRRALRIPNEKICYHKLDFLFCGPLLDILYSFILMKFLQNLREDNFILGYFIQD